MTNEQQQDNVKKETFFVCALKDTDVCPNKECNGLVPSCYTRDKHSCK